MKCPFCKRTYGVVKEEHGRWRCSCCHKRWTNLVASQRVEVIRTSEYVYVPNYSESSDFSFGTSNDDNSDFDFGGGSGGGGGSSRDWDSDSDNSSSFSDSGSDFGGSDD